MKIKKYKNKNLKAFTLIEMLLVVSIIAILGTVIIRLLNPEAHQRNAQNSVNRVRIEDLTAAITSYRELEGHLPEANADLTPKFDDDGILSNYISSWPDGFYYDVLDSENFVVFGESAEHTDEDPDYLVYDSSVGGISECHEDPCYTPPSEDETPLPGGTDGGCEDSDTGKNPDEKGSVVFSGNTYTDECVTGGVKEYYCNADNQAVYVTMNCQFSCTDGACYTPAVCEDNDGGQSPLTAGTVTFDGASYNDYCLPDGSVEEYYCDGDYAYDSLALECAFGCKDGACNETDPTPPPPEVFDCTDPDGGQNYLQKSTVTWGEKSQTDYCSSDTTLREYYCGSSTGPIEYVSHTCDYGCYAALGVCALQPEIIECSDPDGGKNFLQKSTVTWGGQSQTDYCSSSLVLREFYCGTAEGPIEHVYQTCDFGCDTVKGICNPQPVVQKYSCQTVTLNKTSCIRLTSTTDGSIITKCPTCFTSTSIKEYYCGPAGTIFTEQEYEDTLSRVFTCPSGKCLNNACTSEIIQYSCTDSDGGVDKYNKGTVNVGGKNYTDSCADKFTVKEFSCPSNGTSSPVTSYPSCDGQTCFDGKCPTAKFCIGTLCLW